VLGHCETVKSAELLQQFFYLKRLVERSRGCNADVGFSSGEQGLNLAVFKNPAGLGVGIEPPSLSISPISVFFRIYLSCNEKMKNEVGIHLGGSSVEASETEKALLLQAV